jgi:hypothetical protein
MTTRHDQNLTHESTQERKPSQSAHACISDTAALTEAEIAQLVGSIRDVVKTLSRADAESKADVYRELGLKLPYAPANRSVLVEAFQIWGSCSVRGGDLNSIPTSPLLRAELDLDRG